MLDYAEGHLASANFDELVSRIVEPIRMHRPEVILSFGADGVTGDADHAVVSRAVSAAFDAAGQPLVYEDDIEEDQVAWRAAKLYELVVPASRLAVSPVPAPPGYGSPDGRETLTLELGELAQLKLAAIGRHVSQTGSVGPFHDWTAPERDAFLARESYRLAKSNMPVPAGARENVETDLFDGLP
jgi:LmbE family N-acetylglucosaminyl deacetylase